MLLLYPLICPSWPLGRGYVCHSARPAKSSQGWLPCFWPISCHPSCPRVSSPWSEPLASAWCLSLLCHHCLWDRLGCGTPHRRFAPGQTSPRVTGTEKLKGTENKHVRVQLGQILDKIQKDQKAQRPLPRNGEQKQVPRVISAHGTTGGVGRPPQSLLWPNPPTHPYPHPI